MNVDRFQEEFRTFKREREAYDAQNRLFEIFIQLARSPSEPRVLHGTMQSALDIAAEFSGAEKGSLFLIDTRGIVTESILTRTESNPQKKSELIGQVIDKGLAGWVKKELSFGLVSDARSDARWLTLPDQPYEVRSALSVPILRNNTLFGILTLLHSLPSQFDETDAGIIQHLANQMALIIENAKLYKKLEQQKRELESAKSSIENYSQALDDELKRGKKIQRDFLPRQLPNLMNCEVASCFHSALQLSGDFYDAFELTEHLSCFVVGDVSGKGVGAALFMALSRSLLRIFSNQPEASVCPETILQAVGRTNEYLAKEHGDDGMFVTLFFCVLDQSNGKIHYINCGHEPAWIIGKNTVKQSLYPTGPAMGPIPGVDYDIGSCRLETDEFLLVYTDGVTEARSETRDFYTRLRVENLIKNGFNDSASELLSLIEKDLFDFVGKAPQSDDITMMAVKWHPAG